MTPLEESGTTASRGEGIASEPQSASPAKGPVRATGAPSSREESGINRQALRRFLDGWFCGCGNPEDAAAALLRLLRLHPLYEHRPKFEAWLPDDGLQYLLLYMLDRFELTEHGGSVGGAWLTPKGEAVRNALAREEGDDFEALLDEHCIHGFDIGDESHDCMAADDVS